MELSTGGGGGQRALLQSSRFGGGGAAAALVLPGCSAAVETALGSRLMIVTVRARVCVIVLFPFFSCACPYYLFDIIIV